jgi:hypothetical protein
VDLIVLNLRHRSLTLCPPVLTEILSNPNLSARQRDAIGRLPVIELQTGFWET